MRAGRSADDGAVRAWGMAGTTALLPGIARHHGHRGRPVILAQLQTSPHATKHSLLAAEAGQDLDRTAEHAPDRRAVAEQPPGCAVSRSACSPPTAAPPSAACAPKPPPAGRDWL